MECLCHCRCRLPFGRRMTYRLSSNCPPGNPGVLFRPNSLSTAVEVRLIQIWTYNEQSSDEAAFDSINILQETRPSEDGWNNEHKGKGTHDEPHVLFIDTVLPNKLRVKWRQLPVGHVGNQAHRKHDENFLWQSHYRAVLGARLSITLRQLSDVTLHL